MNAKFTTTDARTTSPAAEQLRCLVPHWAQLAENRRVLGVVLGSGLGGLADQIEQSTAVRLDALPGLARSTAAGHRGEFLLGKIGETPVFAMAGRLHVYEGHPLEAVARPISVMAAMGVTDLVVSCAAGGLNPRFSVGDCVLIDERISWLTGAMGKTVLPIGESGFPPLPQSRQHAVDAELIQWADDASRRGGWSLLRGTYLAVNGPNYETRAECRMMRTMGVDLVGMSTVPELLAASVLGLRSLALGIVTNMAIPDAVSTASHSEVLAVANRAGEKLQAVVFEIAGRLTGRLRG